MKVSLIIPARYASSRFPGKPLAEIKGVSLLQRVWAIGSSVPGVDEVIVATDDARIKQATEAFGAAAIMTPETCRNGTERAAAVLELLPEKPDIIINLQGDAVLTPPWVIAPVVDALRSDPSMAMATPAVALSSEQLSALKAHKETAPASGTTVVVDHAGDALYFSKAILPFQRKADARLPIYRHIGLYGYQADTLRRLVSLPETPLERVEGLEQLRALYHGIPIHVAEVTYRDRTHWSVDSPEDLTAAEDLIAREGELLPRYDGTYRWETAE